MPKKFLSNRVLLGLLERASDDERLTLTKILDPLTNAPLNGVLLQQRICAAGGHGVANWLRGQGTGYIDMLDDVVDSLKVGGVPSYRGERVFDGLSLWQIDEVESIRINKRDTEKCLKLGIAHVEMAENKVLIQLLESAYKNMSQSQRLAFDARVREVANQFGSTSGKNIAGGAGLMVLGNLGGFATYTLMSTILSTISFGALGFGAYTAASSVLSFVLGPAGWVAMGGAAIHAMGKPELKTTIPLVANVAMIRQRLSNGRRN